MPDPDVSLAHDDSLTNIINDVVEKHALKISDVKKLKKGDKISVILFDRNIGDYLHGTPQGTQSTKEYLEKMHLATFTQGEDYGITGSLYLFDIGEEFSDWTWQINVAKYNDKSYWSPIDDSCSCGDHPASEYLREFRENPVNIPGETKVGWRGPAILAEDIQNMPETFIHYDTCVDDYNIIRSRDLSAFETTNALSGKADRPKLVNRYTEI